MKEIVVFGSEFCPDCAPAIEYLSEKNIEYVYLDISAGMLNLKKFLNYRDNYDEFKEIKQAGNIGIPCIVVNDGERIIFDYNEL